ncbi:MAG: RHS repeat-associated core domain-containing protein [Acidimicrobiales bacterium]
MNRYYDPTTDQFISIDPLVATTNQPYVFTNDNPLNATDPLGQCGGWFHVICSATDGVGHFVLKHSTGILQTVEISGALACAFASAGTAADVCFVAAASSFTTGVAVSVVQDYNPKTRSENYVALGANVALDGLSAIGPPDTSQPLRAILGVTNVAIVLEHSVTTTSKKKKKKWG